ncbi:hypothetical protein GSI_00662 [Ganoderma sinense ZZ0214-1]|uniref:Uncharacterized protein n=1 Tax=Ganoderma sinense ZZ0214-1 TaxID=1077348 RepID=A0A2G8ST80_9APHY|nr:hypothetical protein GSI_00662 [Ganoderma sinense ZZ0214-1]
MPCIPNPLSHALLSLAFRCLTHVHLVSRSRYPLPPCQSRPRSCTSPNSLPHFVLFSSSPSSHCPSRRYLASRSLVQRGAWRTGTHAYTHLAYFSYYLRARNVLYAAVYFYHRLACRG